MSLLRAVKAQSPSNQKPAMGTVSTEEGQGLLGAAIDVEVWEGHATAIDFSRTGEVITQVFLADPSRIVYSTDAQLDSNQATAIFLRQITPLDFPNLTTASTTNLFVTTIRPNGLVRLYTFNILFGTSSPKYSGISISNLPTSINQQTWEVGYSTPATLDDIERGLQVAIKRNYTSLDDPVVVRVKEFLALSRNNTPIPEAANRAGISLALVTELGKLGLEELRQEGIFKTPEPELVPPPIPETFSPTRSE